MLSTKTEAQELKKENRSKREANYQRQYISEYSCWSGENCCTGPACRRQVGQCKDRTLDLWLDPVGLFLCSHIRDKK